MPSNSQIYQRAEFFSQRPNFSAGLASKFCQELATLFCTEGALLTLNNVAPVYTQSSVGYQPKNSCLYKTVTISTSLSKEAIENYGMFYFKASLSPIRHTFFPSLRLLVTVFVGIKHVGHLFEVDIRSKVTLSLLSHDIVIVNSNKLVERFLHTDIRGWEEGHVESA
jgi:hypothetical protein